MRVTLLAKDQSSGGQGCPSGYLADNGMCVIQGPEVDATTYAHLANVLPGERGVLLKPQVILDLADQLRALG
ncbi:MAG: hypothetical protein ACRDR6_01545 [Pseudonocardiaceae bacterium]